MKAICVDDEPILLNWLLEIVKQSEDISDAVGFSSCVKALKYIEENDFDIAFIDVELGKMNGIELAKRLRTKNPYCGIVFCTGHANYAVDAIKDLIVNGYLLKPIEAVDVQNEIEKFKQYNKITKQLITVDLTNGMEILNSSGKQIKFKRKLTLKLFSELIEEKGKSVSVAQLCSRLWDDNDDPYLYEKNKDYMFHLIMDLRKTLEDNGLYDAIRKDAEGFAINMSCIKVLN